MLVHQKPKRAGITLMLLWEEYATGAGDKGALAYKYTCPVKFEVTLATRDAVQKWIKRIGF